jgi:hypothetical protein
MQYIQKVNIIICINWVQIEYVEGESTCLARTCPADRTRTSLVLLPRNQLLISIRIPYYRYPGTGVLGPCFVAEGPAGRNTFGKACLYVIPKLSLMKLRYYNVSEDEGSN